MQIFHAREVSVDTADLEYGEGWLCFCWPDGMYGSEQLQIDMEGHCSRAMPIRSGQGPPEFVTVERDRVVLRFRPALARKLELDDEIEIRFSINDDDYQKLCDIVAYFSA